MDQTVIINLTWVTAAIAYGLWAFFYSTVTHYRYLSQARESVRRNKGASLNYKALAGVWPIYFTIGTPIFSFYSMIYKPLRFVFGPVINHGIGRPVRIVLFGENKPFFTEKRENWSNLWQLDDFDPVNYPEPEPEPETQEENPVRVPQTKKEILAQCTRRYDHVYKRKMLTIQANRVLSAIERYNCGCPACRSLSRLKQEKVGMVLSEIETHINMHRNHTQPQGFTATQHEQLEMLKKESKGDVPDKPCGCERCKSHRALANRSVSPIPDESGYRNM